MSPEAKYNDLFTEKMKPEKGHIFFNAFSTPNTGSNCWSKFVNIITF